MQPWKDLLVSWAPMLLFVGVWFYFMRRSRWGSAQEEYNQRSQEHMRKVEELLARIATALEKR